MRCLVVIACALPLAVACERSDGSARGAQGHEQQASREADQARREAEQARVLTVTREACRALGACLDERGPRGCEPERVVYLAACTAPGCAETYDTLFAPGFVSRQRLCEYSAVELKAVRAACEKYLACMADRGIPMCAKPSNCHAPTG